MLRVGRQLLTSSRSAQRWTRQLSIPAKKEQGKVIFSGIQPTGVPHLGNYLGALQQWVKFQDDAEPGTELIYSVVDLHAITVPQSSDRLRQWRRETLASLLAVGLNPERSIIFYQSDVPSHAELMWILSCSASVGYLSRMTQWKSKLNLPDNAKPLDKPLQLGLFSYPVLMAADVLLYNTTHVPVGEDQSQHLEFARNCAVGFNALYGDVFVEPSTLLAPAKRVMSLSTPGKKMSKSDANPKSRIHITDGKAEIEAKVRTAVTDSVEGISYDPKGRPGVSNLLEIMFHLGVEGPEPRAESVQELADDCKDLSKKAFKEKVAATIDGHLAPIRERYHEILNNGDGQYLSNVAEDGAARAGAKAKKTMKRVRAALGL